jgi:L-threonylcarbamoyladenylate synthase
VQNQKTNDPEAQDFARLSSAIETLERGGVIVFPTETLYGLGADALNTDAVGRVFELKGRDPRNPIPVLVADDEMLLRLVSNVPPLAQKLIRGYWPGPLTLVLPGRPELPKPLLNARGGVGVRTSSEAIATELVRRFGRPLTATSANPAGKEPARTLEEAKRYFSGKIDVFIDGGKLRSKTGSTVVEVSGDSVTVIREGEISAAEINRQLTS